MVTLDAGSIDPPKFERRFARRVFVTLFLTLVISGVVTGSVGFWLTYRTTQRMKSDRANALLHHLSSHAEHAVISRDNTFLTPTFRFLLGSQAVESVAVYTTKGELLFSSEKSDVPKLPTHISPPETLPPAAIKTYNVSGDSRILITPIYSTSYDREEFTFGSREELKTHTALRGYALMGTTTSLTPKEKRASIIKGIGLFLGVVLLGTLLSLGAAAKISGPILRIISGINRFSRGELEARIRITSHDEMGQIAYSFNRLATSFAQHMEELERWGKTLEQEVHKRTTEITSTRRFLGELIAPLSNPKERWKRIVTEIQHGAGALACALYAKEEGGAFSLLASTSTGDALPKLTPNTSGKLGRETRSLGKEGEVEIAWYPLLLNGEEEGQLLFAFPPNSSSTGFVNQVLSALTITFVNIHSFEALQHLKQQLELQNRVLLAQKMELETQKVELQKQNERIEESSKLKSEFLANVSHELRTPINAIIGYSEMITAGYYGEITEEQKERMGAIEESGRILLNLINTILDHSRMEAGKLPLYVEAIEDLRKVISDTVARNQSLTREKPYTIETDLPSFPIPCRNDGGKISQILTNLVSNAVKFTNSGSVRVSLTTAHHDILLQVTDTGMGIPKKEQERVFEAFTQGDGSPTRVSGGTGLGLAVCGKLTQLIGGTISVTSHEGKGSTFTVTFPRQYTPPE